MKQLPKLVNCLLAKQQYHSSNIMKTNTNANNKGREGFFQLKLSILQTNKCCSDMHIVYYICTYRTIVAVLVVVSLIIYTIFPFYLELIKNKKNKMVNYTNNIIFNLSSYKLLQERRTTTTPYCMCDRMFVSVRSAKIKGKS